MKWSIFAALPAALVAMFSSPGWAQSATAAAAATSVSQADIEAVAPGLGKYNAHILHDELWKRPGLTPRDRSVVTVAALIARNQTAEMSYYFDQALNNGVKPAELSEIITHLAFYSGFSNAIAAVPAAKAVFTERGIGAEQLPSASPTLAAVDKDAEVRRKASVQASVGPVAQGVVKYTDQLFNDVWVRPDLSPRDRSLVTISALIVSGQGAQLAGHLERAIANGVTKPQISETLTQLEFFGGWPNVFSAVPIVKQVFDKHPT
jgi:4-carboxymuconolactone decarboxylase